VPLTVAPGVSSVLCPACGQEIPVADPPAGPDHLQAFAGMEGDFRERVRQRVEDAYAASAENDAIAGMFLNALIKSVRRSDGLGGGAEWPAAADELPPDGVEDTVDGGLPVDDSPAALPPPPTPGPAGTCSEPFDLD
jgi:hypothetical protein